MQRTQYDGEHEYLVSPESVGDYPITDNETHSTYDQFIQLRDTLIFSGKYYNDKPWAKLIVWKSKETIEVIWKNRWKMGFEPWYASDVENLTSLEAEWPYVTWLWADPQYATQYTAFWPLSCIINEDGRYRLTHKEELDITNTALTTVCCYIDIYRKDSWGTYQNLIPWWVAVSWWKANWTLTWTTSGTNPNWTCTVSFTLWKIFQKMPTWWYVERDLKKWDILVLRLRDAEPNAQWEPQWNELPLQQYSNVLSVEYIDLPLTQTN